MCLGSVCGVCHGNNTEQCSLHAVRIPVRAAPLCTFLCMESNDVSDAGFLLLPAATYTWFWLSVSQVVH